MAILILLSYPLPTTEDAGKELYQLVAREDHDCLSGSCKTMHVELSCALDFDSIDKGFTSHSSTNSSATMPEGTWETSV